MTKNKIYFIFLVTLLSCANAQQGKKTELELYPAKINGWILSRVFEKTYFDTSYSITFKGNTYNIQFIIPPNNNHQLILYLPGWNLPASDWKTKTFVIDSAVSSGYCALLVDMGKSIYLDTFYTNTRSDYRNHPTRQWLRDVVLAPYRDAGYFSDVDRGLKSHIFGLSTGARGAVALSQDHYLSVNFIAALSGDYHPIIDTTDALMINAMGRYYQHPERWKFGSNNLLRDRKVSTHVFLAHGKKDKIVSPQHTMEFAEWLNQSDSTEKRGSVFTFISENGAHDYRFWNESGLKALKQLKKLYP